jgi:hypothetical protein
MQPPVRLRIAPFLDAACIVAFVLVGRGRHDIHEGVSWFLMVLWPLFVGWFGAALVTRLYTRADGVWAALAATLLGGVVLASLLRGAFTPRPYFGIFTIIALAFLGLTTFGWRAIAAPITRRRRAATPAAS